MDTRTNAHPDPRPATGDVVAPAGDRVAVWVPLAVPVFRALWITALVSNIGTWMQTVGAQWFMVEQHTSPLLITLVQTASAAPVLLLGIPAGVLGELFNRRTLLIWMQVVQLLVTGALVALTVTGQLTPYLLLAITLVLGASSAVQLPAYQALVTEIVPGRMIPSAASLSAISVNAARAIGPALAGALLSGLGIAFVFAMNVVSFAAFLLVLIVWRSYRPEAHATERFIDAARAGIRYVTRAAVVRRMYVRLGAFVVPASALYALLPLLATGRLGLDSLGYGLLLAAMGAGSVTAAFLVPWFRRLGAQRAVLLCSGVFGAATVGVALAPAIGIALPLLAFAGAAWIGVVATINGAVQAFLPVWVRTRGLSVYQMVLFGSMAAGGLLSGVLAGAVGPSTAGVVAGGAVLAVAVTQIFWPLLETADKRRTTFSLSVPDAAQEVDGDAAVLVLVRYAVPDERRTEFIERMILVEHSRRRTGARSWALYRDREDASLLVEAFRVGSWVEHEQQHSSRLTDYDHDVIERAGSLADSVTVDHLVEVTRPSSPTADHPRTSRSTR